MAMRCLLAGVALALGVVSASAQQVSAGADDGAQGLPVACRGAPATNGVAAKLPRAPGQVTSYPTSDLPAGGWDGDTVVVVRFTMPALPAALDLEVVPSGPAIRRTAALATTPCRSDAAGTLAFHETGAVKLALTTGAPRPGQVQLQPGQTYYLTLRNAVAGTPTCPGDTCDAIVLLRRRDP